MSKFRQGVPRKTSERKLEKILNKSEKNSAVKSKTSERLPLFPPMKRKAK